MLDYINLLRYCYFISRNLNCLFIKSNMLMKIRFFSILFTLLLPSSLVYSQKKALDYSVFDIWNDVQGTTISNNGKFVAYALTPQEGDSRLILQNMETDSTDTIS